MASDLTVDASVWVGAIDETEASHEESLELLAATAVAGVRLIVPAFADAEVACAVARKLRSTAAGRRLAQDVLQGSQAMRVPVDAALIEAAIRIGTTAFLRGADALYAAAAHTGSTLIS